MTKFLQAAANQTPRTYQPWHPLKPGAIVDVIAPAGGCSLEILAKIKTFLISWNLRPRLATDLFGPDWLCANDDDHRFKQLHAALVNQSSSVVWCLRGGYGSTRLLPALMKVDIPAYTKLFIGFSDITALHIFLQQTWHWQTLHGPSLTQIVQKKIDSASIEQCQQIIFGRLQKVTFELEPLNQTARASRSIVSSLIGGTLSLIQTSLATNWQILTNDKILFLEEVNESAYRVDRMLNHLEQAGILSKVTALLFGDFIITHSPQQQALTASILQRFAEQQSFPVLRCRGIGHGCTNYSLPLASKTILNLTKARLTIEINH